MKRKKTYLKNIIMLYGMSIAKIVFPLLTLPYLTRVLFRRKLRRGFVCKSRNAVYAVGCRPLVLCCLERATL